MPDPAAGLLQNQGDPEPLGSPGSACFLLCLSCTQHRAVIVQTMTNSCRNSGTKRAVRGWRELPPPEVQPPSGPHLGLHSRHLSRQIVRCMKHRPRLWQELVLNGRLSQEALDYIRQIIIDPAIVYPCCLISINSSLGELARDSVPPSPCFFRICQKQDDLCVFQ